MKLPGPFSITRVVETEGPSFAPDFLLPDAVPDAFAQTDASRDPRFYDAASNKLVMGFYALIIRTERNVILVDTCVGNDKERPMRPDWHRRNGSFLTDLAASGCPAESVTHVLCTHLHVDHVGWNTRLIGGRWVPTFPNAKYLMARTEVDHWQEVRRRDANVNHGSWDDSVQPILDAGLAVIVDSDYEIEPGIHLMPAPGHTPGNVILCLDDGKQRAYLVGDTIHHPVQIERPQWSSRFCADPQLAATTRIAFIERVAESGAWVLPAHFPRPTAVQITGDAGGFGFTTPQT